MDTVTIYTLDEWLEEFTPVRNHINPTHGFDMGEGCTLFETYGKELDYVVQNVHGNRVWTVCEEDGYLYIVNGMYTVNRLGYLITENNYASGEIIHVNLGEDN